MKKFKSLVDIFADVEFDLVDDKKEAKKSTVQNTDQRLLASFEQINSFFEKNDREPEANIANISEYQLYTRLKSLKESPEKIEALKSADKFKLLKAKEEKKIESLEDIFNDDDFSILDNDEDEGLFDFRHTPKEYERAASEFVARRKRCKDFEKYEQLFKEVQKDLSENKRKLIYFKEENLRKGTFYVHNGILLYLEKTIDLKKDKFGKLDGRTRVVFENGTESGMKFRTLGKNLFANGKAVSENIDKVNEQFIEKFSDITDDDKEAGYIYILKSKSTDQDIKSIQNLYKIGYSSTPVEERIKNAENEATYLMASVKIEAIYKCYNMNPQKFEQLIHNFFGNCCLNVDIFDADGKRYTPREWFIVPMKVIDQTIELIINGQIIHYRYDVENKVIVKRS